MVRKIRKAAVIGSGVMGGGIAALLASAGIKAGEHGLIDLGEVESMAVE